MLEGEKLMTVLAGPSLPLPPVSVAVPENAKLPASIGNDAVTVSLNVPDAGAVKGIEPVIGNPSELGESSISYESVYCAPGVSADTARASP